MLGDSSQRGNFSSGAPTDSETKLLVSRMEDAERARDASRKRIEELEKTVETLQEKQMEANKKATSDIQEKYVKERKEMEEKEASLRKQLEDKEAEFKKKVTEMEKDLEEKVAQKVQNVTSGTNKEKEDMQANMAKTIREKEATLMKSFEEKEESIKKAFQEKETSMMKEMNDLRAKYDDHLRKSVTDVNGINNQHKGEVRQFVPQYIISNKFNSTSATSLIISNNIE